MITSTQDFDYSYLCAVSHALHKTMEQPQNRQTRITLYMHLILAQVTNLDEM